MADFYLYADESGKFHKSDQVSFCGYLTHLTEWERISMEWISARLAWDVPPLHMADIMFPERAKDNSWVAVKEKWKDTWEKRRKEMLDEFAALIMRSHAACVGCSVDADHFRRMPDSKFKQDMRDPNFLSIHVVVMNALELVDRVAGGGKSISLVFDDDQEYATTIYKYVDDLRTHFPIGKRIESICFVDDRAYPGIQAADMIAYETRDLLTKRMNDPNVEPSRLYVALTRKMVHQPKLYTPFFLDELAKRWKSQ